MPALLSILHRSAESLRPVYRLAESPVGAVLINGMLGLRLGASFSNHPKHALRHPRVWQSDKQPARRSLETLRVAKEHLNEALFR